MTYDPSFTMKDSQQILEKIRRLGSGDTPEGEAFAVEFEQVFSRCLAEVKAADAHQHQQDDDDDEYNEPWEDIRQSVVVVNVAMAEAGRIAANYAIDEEPKAVLAIAHMILSDYRVD